MGRGKRGRGARRGGGNNNFGENGTDGTVRYYYSSERGFRSGQVYANRAPYVPPASCGIKERDNDNGRSLGEDGWREKQRSSGYAGFSTGSFGVMGDVDSVNRSDTQSPEVSCSTEVPLASVEDLRYKAEEIAQIRRNYSLDVGNSFSMKTKEAVKGERIQLSSVNMGVSNNALKAAVTAEEVQNVGDLPQIVDGAVNSTHASQKLWHEQKTAVAPSLELELEHGIRPRAMSYHADNTSGVYPNIANRRYRSSVVIDRGLAQYLQSNYSQSGVKETTDAQIGEDKATIGLTIKQVRYDIPHHPSVTCSGATSESLSHEGHRSAVSASEADLVRYRGEQEAQRHFRSVSQTVLDKPCDRESPLISGEVVKSQRSISRTLEEENEGFISNEEEQIRTVQNDDHYNNHRLSKLSIHTNNDEFFYLAGHPPSDGRTSLRSRGSVSRQSMQSADFFAGSPAGVNNDWLETAQMSASRHSLKGHQVDVAEVDRDGEVFVDTSKVERRLEHQAIPTIQINGRTLSATSVTSPNYVTAQDRITSADDEGFIETMPRAQAGCTSSATAVYASEYSTAVANIQSASSATYSPNVASSYKSSVHIISCTPAVEPSEVPPTIEKEDNIDSDLKEAAQMTNARTHTSNLAILRSNQSSQKSVLSNVCSDACNSEAQSLHRSNASLHGSIPLVKTAQSISWQSIQSNVCNDSGSAQPVHVSSTSLHASISPLTKTAQSVSRQSVHSNGLADASDNEMQLLHISDSNKRVFHPVLMKSGQSLSRQSVHSDMSNNVYEDACQPIHASSTNSLHVSNPVLQKTTESNSRQSMHSNVCIDTHDESAQPVHLSTSTRHMSTHMEASQLASCHSIPNRSSATGLHASNTILLERAHSSSRESQSNECNDLCNGAVLPQRVSSTSLHVSDPMLVKTTQSVSRQSVRSNICDEPFLTSTTSLRLLTNTAQSASGHSMLSNACSDAYDEATQATQMSESSRHSSKLGTAQWSPRRSLHSDMCDDEYDEITKPVHVSTTMYASNPVLRKTDQSQSCQSVHTNSGLCDGTDLPVLASPTSMHASNTALQKSAQSSSRQSVHSDVCKDVHDEAVQPGDVPTTNLHASNSMIMKTVQAASWQQANLNVHRECCETSRALCASTRSLQASNPELQKTAQSLSRQSIHSNVRDDVYGEATQPIDMSATNLCSSNLSLMKTAQSLSCQNVYSNACNDICDEPSQPVHASNESPYASNPALMKTAQSSSRQSGVSNISLHASDHVQLETAQSVSCQNVQSDVCNEESYVEEGQSQNIFTSGLQASNPILLKVSQSASCQNQSDMCNTAVEGEVDPVQVFIPNVCIPSTNLLEAVQSVSHHNNQSNACGDVYDEASQLTDAHRCNVYDSTSTQLRTAQSTSQQNICSSTRGIAEGEPAYHINLSSRSLQAVNPQRSNVCNSACDVTQGTHVSTSIHLASNPVLLKTSQSASHQSINSNICNEACDEVVQPVHSFMGSLSASDQVALEAVRPASRHSVCSNYDEGFDEIAQSTQASRSSVCDSNVVEDRVMRPLHVYSTNLSVEESVQMRTARSTSCQNHSSTCNFAGHMIESVDISLNSQQGSASTVALAASRNNIATESVLKTMLSRSGTSHSDLNNNMADFVGTAQCPNINEAFTTSSKDSSKMAPKPAVRRSLQAIPTAVSHSSSGTSVNGLPGEGIHVFETKGGGLWYHFSDTDRNHSRSVANSLNCRQSGDVVKGQDNSVPATQIPSKKPPRSRSSSASRNEVHFSSIPQLLSHPDDRFGVEMSGVPFRSTSEHELTPHAQKSSSRTSVVTASEATSDELPHKASVVLNNGLLTVPVHARSTSEITTSSETNPRSRTPSLKSMDVVPSPLIVTDALTPKRPPLVQSEEEDYSSPASFNRTLFSREAFQRRRIREPKRAEVAIQTGETIRLRQGMSFGEELSEDANVTARAITTPTNGPVMNPVSKRTNGPLEKNEHPATPVINAMLQQRQMHSEHNRGENRQPAEDVMTSYSRAETITKDHEMFQQNKRSALSGQRRSFIDNEHHQYETRTNKEWRSSTRSQYEEEKLDENYNEILSNNVYQEPMEELGVRDCQNTRQKRYSESDHRCEISDQVFEEPCPPLGREMGRSGDAPPLSNTAEQLGSYTVGEAQSSLTACSDWRRGYVDQNPSLITSARLQEAVDRSASVPTPSIVIHRETAEELRQKVLAESRPPLTPRSARLYGYDNHSALPDSDHLSTNDLAAKNSATANDFTSYVQPSRISINMPNSSPFYSPTSSRWRKGSETSGPSSPYKWQVPDIDIHREYREPDARSNDSKISGTGSTVRRHIPRGRIRDLARLFDKMTRQAEREAAVLRGKSLPPTKRRSKYTRTFSMPRPQDLRAREEKLEQEQDQQGGEPAVRELLVHRSYTGGGVINSQGDYGEHRQHEDSRKNSVGDAVESAMPSCDENWKNLPCTTGLEPGMLHPTIDDRASTDSRLDLRRTSTPLATQVIGDLANAFGRIPSIHSPDATALCGGKRMESLDVKSNNDGPPVEDARNLQAVNKSNNRSFDHHYAKPAIVKPDLPPQRLSVIHPNSTHHGYCLQHRRSYSHQIHGSDHPDGEPTYARINRVSANQYRPQLTRREIESCPRSAASQSTQVNVITNVEAEKASVNGEIDKMFEFVEDQDGLSTIGRETVSERASIVKADGYGIVHGDSDHLAELHVQPPQPQASPHGLETTALSSQNATQPLKYSMSAFRDMQRTHRMGGYLPLDAPPRFSPLTAPTAGIGVSTYKSREGTVGEKVNTYSQFSRNTSQHPSALATSTPVDSPAGTGFSQRIAGVPNFDDSFISAITTGTHPRDAHEEYKRQMTKLNNQIRVQEEQIEMTLKVLALARKKQKCMQELSAQRTLLLARERLDLLRCEISRISALAAVRNPPPPVNRELRGTMTISNICVYLNRSFCQRQYEHESSYALLILLKCGSEVEATGPVSLLAHTQNRVRQLTFAENVQFSNLPVDFNVVLEVYAMKLPIMKTAENSCASNIANKCKNLLSPALAHRSSCQDGSEFIRCGYIILNRDTVGMNKFYLDEAEYPLEGTIEVYCRCTTLPPAIEVENRGFLTMYQTISGIGSWERYWAVLRRGMVYFWRYPDEESMEKRPIAFMDLSKCTNDSVAPCTQEQCPRENSFSIDMLVCTTPSLMEKKRVLLSADSEELLYAWLQALNETLSVLRG